MHQSLKTHYLALQELEEMYHSYQLAYDHLILEMDRRARYRNAMQNMISEMTAQLQAIRNGTFSSCSILIGDPDTYSFVLISLCHRGDGDAPEIHC